MLDHMSVGLRRHMFRLPAVIGRRRVASLAKRARTMMDGLPEQHRVLHRFLVAELPRAAKPLTPESIADQLGLTPQHVAGLLDDLGDKKALIARDADGAITWAYPVTVAETPHKLCFESGERLFAAWAADAIAAPFVQGRLRDRDMTVVVETACHHCSQAFTLEIDNDMNVKIRTPGAKPVVFVPDVVPFDVEGPDIVEEFWHENVFFWSEEHAKEYRKSHHRIRGVYAPLDAIADNNRILQSAIFGFDHDTHWCPGCVTGLQNTESQGIILSHPIDYRPPTSWGRPE